MYNNIGLATARGSGTNGYVQRNLSAVRSRKEKVDYINEEALTKMEQTYARKPNKEILEHQRKREVELKCLELQDIMEEQGYNDDEIEEKVSQLRATLSSAFEEKTKRNLKETHQMAEAAEEKNSKMKDALGIKQDYKDGSSFNQELMAVHRALELKQKEDMMQKNIDIQREKERDKRSKEKQTEKKKKRKRSPTPESSSDSGSRDSTDTEEDSPPRSHHKQKRHKKPSSSRSPSSESDNKKSRKHKKSKAKKKKDRRSPSESPERKPRKKYRGGSRNERREKSESLDRKPRHKKKSKKRSEISSPSPTRKSNIQQKLQRLAGDESFEGGRKSTQRLKTSVKERKSRKEESSGSSEDEKYSKSPKGRQLSEKTKLPSRMRKRSQNSDSEPSRAIGRENRYYSKHKSQKEERNHRSSSYSDDDKYSRDYRSYSPARSKRRQPKNQWSPISRNYVSDEQRSKSQSSKKVPFSPIRRSSSRSPSPPTRLLARSVNLAGRRRSRGSSPRMRKLSRSQTPPRRHPSRSPVRQRKKSSRSPSPQRRNISRSPSPRRRRISSSPSNRRRNIPRSPSLPRRRISRSPSPRKRRISRTPSPRKRVISRSPSPPRRKISRSPSPPRRKMPSRLSRSPISSKRNVTRSPIISSRVQSETNDREFDSPPRQFRARNSYSRSPRVTRRQRSPPRYSRSPQYDTTTRRRESRSPLTSKALRSRHESPRQSGMQKSPDEQRSSWSDRGRGTPPRKTQAEENYETENRARRHSSGDKSPEKPFSKKNQLSVTRSSKSPVRIRSQTTSEKKEITKAMESDLDTDSSSESSEESTSSSGSSSSSSDESDSKQGKPVSKLDNKGTTNRMSTDRKKSFKQSPSSSSGRKHKNQHEVSARPHTKGSPQTSYAKCYRKPSWSPSRKRRSPEWITDQKGNSDQVTRGPSLSYHHQEGSSSPRSNRTRIPPQQSKQHRQKSPERQLYSPQRTYDRRSHSHSPRESKSPIQRYSAVTSASSRQPFQRRESLEKQPSINQGRPSDVATRHRDGARVNIQKPRSAEKAKNEKGKKREGVSESSSDSSDDSSYSSESTSSDDSSEDSSSESDSARR